MAKLGRNPAETGGIQYLEMLVISQVFIVLCEEYIIFVSLSLKD